MYVSNATYAFSIYWKRLKQKDYIFAVLMFYPVWPFKSAHKYTWIEALIVLKLDKNGFVKQLHLTALIGKSSLDNSSRLQSGNA